jgi:hypothetical protein
MARGKTHLALLEALKFLEKQRRLPTEADRRPVRPLPGPKPAVLDGQIDIFGHVHGDAEDE